MPSYVVGGGKRLKDEVEFKTRVLELLKASKEADFLVGYFYFSGLTELYEALKEAIDTHNTDLVLKVLVGLYVDILNDRLVEVDYDDKLSLEQKQKMFLESLEKSLRHRDFDNAEFYRQAKFFVRLIEENRLIIRKTRRPNHSKLYLFFSDEEKQVFRDRLAIIGSSNLTRAGISARDLRDEINVEITDYLFDELKAYFDKLWENSIPISEEDAIRLQLTALLKTRTLLREITPFEAYVWVLKNYLDYYEQEGGETIAHILKKAGFIPYRYQIDAVLQALAVIERHGGVIIADVVGLGKSVIAGALAKRLGQRGVVLSPPSLIGDRYTKDSGWYFYLDRFGLYDWDVYSIGKLEDIRLSDDVEVVIVDEAHRFRNENTKRYELLRNLTRGRKVILLTATPINNSPSDIFSLLKLFVVPKKSTITLTDNVQRLFSELQSIHNKLVFIKKNISDPDKSKRVKKYYEEVVGEGTPNIASVKRKMEQISRRIKDLIEPVVIRRNRLDLQENPRYRDEVRRLSQVADPMEWFYELTPEQSRFYDEVIKAFSDEGSEILGRFRGAIYRPYFYEKDRSSEDSSSDFEYLSQSNLYNFMRRLLVKRFESSFGAFKSSIENFKRVHERALDFVKRTGRYILDRRLIEKVYDSDYEDVEEVLAEYEKEIAEYEEEMRRARRIAATKIYKREEMQRGDEFISDIKADIELFDEILNMLEKLKLVENDPKLQSFMDNVERFLREDQEEVKRKVVVFSEYRDTVKYIEQRLKSMNHPEGSIWNRVLVVTDNVNKSTIEKILSNFDASYDRQADDYDILIATDRLSEGFNLARAGLVVNYDIPWNPVRVVQRVGRINRIGQKVFDCLYIANFFPTEKGANEVKSREIATAKMFLIHNVLGEDAKIFDPAEEPRPSELYKRLNMSPDRFEEESFYTRVVREFEEIKEKYPEVVDRLKDMPPRVKVAKRSEEDELVVFIRKDRLHAIRIPTDVEASGRRRIWEDLSLADAIEKIKCEPDTEAIPWDVKKFWDAYDRIKDLNIADIGLGRTEGIALNVLDTLVAILKKCKSSDECPFSSKVLDKGEINDLIVFIQMLEEDIRYYGTLPKITVNKISKLNTEKDSSIKYIKELREQLGPRYLEREKKRLSGKLNKEIIIAVYNRSDTSLES